MHGFVRGFGRCGIGSRAEQSKIGVCASFVCHALHTACQDKPSDGFSLAAVWAGVTAGDCKPKTGALCTPAISSETA